MKKLTDRLPKNESVEDILKDYTHAKGDKANFESTYESIRKLFAPYQESITGDETDGGELDFSDIWTDSPIEAVRVFVSGLQTYLVPINTKWIQLRMTDKALENSGAVKQFLEDVEERVMFTLANSNFYAAIAELFTQSVLYGTATMMIDYDPEDKVRFKTVPIKNVCIKDDSRGKVGKTFIAEYFTLEQAAEKWGEENLSPEMRTEYMNADNMQRTYEFVYCIKERKVRDASKNDVLNMPIYVAWIDVTNKYKIEEGGFLENPTASHRFYKRSTSANGYSPCYMCLPSGRTLNKVAQTNLRGGAKLVDPALAMPSKGFLTKLNANPNAINFYQKDISKDSIFEIPGGRGVPFGVEYEDRLDARLRRFLFNDVFKALGGVTKQMTVPEVNQLIQEALTQIGPAIGRYQSEILDTIITRTVAILGRYQFLPEAPEELIGSVGYEIEYTSYLAKLQKAGGVKTIYEGLGVLQQLAAFDPAVIDNLNADEAWNLTTEELQLPAGISRDIVQVAQVRQARAEAEQARTEIDTQQQQAGTAKDLAQAGAAIQ